MRTSPACFARLDMRQLVLDILSDSARLAPARRAVEAFSTSCGFDEKTVGEVGLCVNEALANIIRHAYHGRSDRPIRIEANFDRDLLSISIRDWGNGHDPSMTPDKEDPLTPGGLGLVCMRSLMTQVTFSPQPDGMLLTLTRQKR